MEDLARGDFWVAGAWTGDGYIVGRIMGLARCAHPYDGGV